MSLYDRGTEPKEISDEVLKEAIKTSFSECFVAMLYANAFAGQKTTKWSLIHDYKVEEMLEEAKVRGLLVEEWHCAIPPEQLIIESKRYKKVMAKT